MKSMLIPALVLASGISLATAACSGKDDDNAAPSATDTSAIDTGMAPATTGTVTANSPAAQFLTEAMKGDNSEVRVGQLAQDKGSSQGVRDFGKMLANDHGKHKELLAQLAMAMNVPTTDETKAEADALYGKLQGLTGAEFDKAFIAGMVEDHEKDIASYQKEADSSDPVQLTDLAKQTLPTLKKHLQTAQGLQK